MKPTGMTATIGRYCAEHAGIVFAGWVVGLAVFITAAAAFGGELSDEDEFVSKPESEQAYQLLGERWDRRDDDGYSELVIVRSEDLTVDDPHFRETVESISAQLGDSASTITYYDAVAAGDDRASLLVSPDRKTTLIATEPRLGDRPLAPSINSIARTATGFEVLAVSEQLIDDEMDRLIEEDLIRSEIIGIPAALIVLAVVFGALVAAGIPVLLALFAMAGAVALSLLLATVIDVSIYAINMISMIGLAVGVDYALLIVDRYRHERRRGETSLDAIEIASGTAGRTVVFSGLTVAISLFGLFLLPTTLFRSLAMGAILVVLVTVLASLTLVPAFVRLAGDRLDWPRRSPRLQATDMATSGSFWRRVARLVMARPVVSIVLSAGVLLALAIPFTTIERGSAGIESLPPGELRRAYEILAEDFAAGMVEPLMIVVDTSRDSGSEGAVDHLLQRLAEDAAFGPVISQQWNNAGDLALLEVPLAVDGNSPEGYGAVARLREDYIPAAFADMDGRALVTGQVAEDADLNNLVDQWTPRVLALVLALSFIVLLLAFRSLVVPIKAILMNLLSVGAAYGLLVLIFQEGHGTRLLGFQQVATIEVWVPVFLFAFCSGCRWTITFSSSPGFGNTSTIPAKIAPRSSWDCNRPRGSLPAPR